MRLAVLRRRGRPLFLWLGTLLLILTALLGLISWGLIVLDQMMFPGRGITEMVGLTIVGARQHLAVTPLVVLIVGAQIVVGYGLLAARAWARSFAVLYWPASAAVLVVMQLFGGVPFVRILPYPVEAVITSAIAWWYLYRWADVRRYYDEIARSRVSSTS